MTKSELHSAFFIGIGGIGMSALAQYMRSHGVNVIGYDRVKSEIAEKLMADGISIIFEDEPSLIDSAFLEIDKDGVLIVYTPAIPNDQKIFNFFQDNGFLCKKRAVVLAEILEGYFTLAVAGTHGKTTTSAILAHILNHSGFGCNAFLGGISNDINSNFLYKPHSKYAVVEADEYDRSFLSLHPFASIVTSIEPDHLDIYESKEEFINSFFDFVSQNNRDGIVVLHQSVSFDPEGHVLRYGSSSENRVEGYSIDNGDVTFDLIMGDERISDIEFCLPGIHNAENALAASLLAIHLGIEHADIRNSLRSFSGVHRRFQYHMKSSNLVYIDDYAHHPGELAATIAAVKMLYPEKLVTGVFQPHLYSRTRDFLDEFASSLSELDQVILLEIYPAREAPIPGITSQLLLERIENPRKQLVTKKSLLDVIQHGNFDVLLTLGAGDIDQCVEPIKRVISNKFNLETENK